MTPLQLILAKRALILAKLANLKAAKAKGNA